MITPRFFALLLLAAPLLGATGIHPAFGWAAGCWLFLLLVLLLADLRLSPLPRDWELLRHHEERLSLAAWNQIEITVFLRRGLRALPVWLRDQAPQSFGCEPVQPVLHGFVAPNQPAAFIYQVRPRRRGNHPFGNLYLRWGSVLGLVRRQARFPAGDVVKVYPNLVDVKKYDLLLRKNRLWELGLRNTRIYGAGNEYERLRDYLPDDEYRRINWKATARRGKPITVEYESERSQNLLVLLDVGRMMRSPVGDVAKVDHAINAALLLGFVATQKGDRVGLLAFADSVKQWLAPGSGKGQFYRMLELLYAVEAEPVEPDYEVAFSYLASHQRKRSLILLFTDLSGATTIDTLMAHLVRARQHHLPVLVTLADTVVERMAHQAVTGSHSLYERTAAEQLLDERKLALDRLRSLGILVLDVPAEQLSVAVINRYLELKARTMI